MIDPPRTTSLARLALVAGTALVLFVIEAAVPRPLPWMKLGLGNGAVLLALMLFLLSSTSCGLVVQTLV